MRYTIAVTTSDLSKAEIDKARQLADNPEGITIYYHYDLEKSKLGYKINFSDGFFTSPQDREAYKEVIRGLLSRSKGSGDPAGLIVQGVVGINMMIKEFIDIPELLYKKYGYSAIQAIKPILDFINECWDVYDIHKALVPRCLWENDRTSDLPYSAGFIDGAWGVVIGGVDVGKFILAWSPVLPVGSGRNSFFNTPQAREIRQQTMQFFELVGALWKAEGDIREKTRNTISEQVSGYIVETASTEPQGKYNQGKLIFDVASLFFGVGEVKAALKTGQITSKTAQMLAKIPVNVAKVIRGLPGKLKIVRNNVLAYLVSANTYIEIARFSDDGILIAEKWIDQPVEIVQTIGEVAYKKADNTAKTTAEIAVVKGSDGYGLGVVEEVGKVGGRFIAKTGKELKNAS